MAQIISFAAGLRASGIESIPQVHERRLYRISIYGKDVEVYMDSQSRWRWRAGHYEDGMMAWWGFDFRASGVDFGSSAEAMQDAINRIAGVKTKGVANG